MNVLKKALLTAMMVVAVSQVAVAVGNQEVENRFYRVKGSIERELSHLRSLTPHPVNNEAYEALQEILSNLIEDFIDAGDDSDEVIRAIQDAMFERALLD